ncbi:MAG: hypothetical protein J0M04_11590 [Verrucomicrobia bacterium]|nr:hypothetical protein [Verrucomicrobiota bacterium]
MNASNTARFARFAGLFRRPAAAFAVSLLMCSQPKAAESADSGVASAIEVMMEAQMEEAQRPLRDLDTKYREALEKKRVAAQNAGNLEILVAVASELESLAEGLDSAPPPKHPDLAKMRQIYIDQKAKITPQVERTALAVERSYIKEMNQLVVDLTKSGKAAEALKVRERLEEYVRERDAARKEAAEAKSTDPAVVANRKDKETAKTKKGLEKLLTENSWSWHLDDNENPAFTIRFLEGGKISGPSWLTAWEVLDGETVKITQMTTERYWTMRFSKDRETAKAVIAESTIRDNKSIKKVKK